MPHRGRRSAKGSSQFVAASTASEVYPILRDMFPRHSVSRLDACEDYSGEGTWDKLEAMLTEICTRHGVSMAPFGRAMYDQTARGTRPKAGRGTAEVRIPVPHRSLRERAGAAGAGYLGRSDMGTAGSPRKAVVKSKRDGGVIRPQAGRSARVFKVGQGRRRVHGVPRHSEGSGRIGLEAKRKTSNWRSRSSACSTKA